MKQNFTKMHALGNDFVVIDNRDAHLKRLPQLAKKLCDRRFGIGADQLILLCHSETADFRMRIFNGDGSEVEMCGNGIRCLGKYIWDNILRCEESLYAKKYCQTLDVLAVETLAGIMTLHKTGNLFRVNMGAPVFEPEKIPVDMSRLPARFKGDKILNHSLKVNNKSFRITCVSMGNPHAVIFVKDIESAPVTQFGPSIENCDLFPNRTNVEFIEVLNSKNIKMRVWERGAGETTACGTGASAAAVASILLGLTDSKVTVHLPGGKLLIHWDKKNNRVFMTGPAIGVFDGTVDI